jgi:hypothetical protein
VPFGAIAGAKRAMSQPLSAKINELGRAGKYAESLSPGAGTGRKPRKKISDPYIATSALR